MAQEDLMEEEEEARAMDRMNHPVPELVIPTHGDLEITGANSIQRQVPTRRNRGLEALQARSRVQQATFSSPGSVGNRSAVTTTGLDALAEALEEEEEKDEEEKEDVDGRDRKSVV